MKDISTFWWRQLSLRERQFISWSGVSLLAVLSYAYLWQPLDTERDKLRARLPQMRADAAGMTAEAAEIASLRQNTRTAINSSRLLDTFRQFINESGIDVSSVQIKQIDDQHINISIQKTVFDSWLTLQNRLQSEKKVRLESCIIEALSEAGMSKVQAVISITE
ncbi:MAG: type II secretion system protein M [Sulfuricella denitrificans]|nr:type II secretion system protein M [Sulfuricella denitrificans]